MGDDRPSDEFIIETLWREREERKNDKGGFFGIPDRMIIWFLIGAQALGSGPEVTQTIFKAITNGH